MGSVPFALCSILYTKPFGDSLGLKEKNSEFFFRTPASPPSGRCAGGPTRRSPVGSPPGSGPLCSLLYAYILNLLGILGVSREKIPEFSQNFLRRCPARLLSAAHRALPVGTSEHPHGDVDRMPLRKAHSVCLQVFQELSVYLFSRAWVELVAVRRA